MNFQKWFFVLLASFLMLTQMAFTASVSAKQIAPATSIQAINR